MWLSGCSQGGSAHHLPFSRMVTLLKIFNSSVTYKLHVRRGTSMQVCKNLDYCYERRYWNGVKCVRSFCKYDDMVKQLLLQNIYDKKWWAQAKARKPPVSFSLKMWWEFLYIGFFIWSSSLWRNGSERKEQEKLEGGKTNESLKLGHVKCHCKMLEPWTNAPLWTVCDIGVIWVDINSLGFYQELETVIHRWRKYFQRGFTPLLLVLSIQLRMPLPGLLSPLLQY